MLQLDAYAVFQECDRRVFHERIRSLPPYAYRWVALCYKRAWRHYVRIEDGRFECLLLQRVLVNYQFKRRIQNVEIKDSNLSLQKLTLQKRKKTKFLNSKIQVSFIRYPSFGFIQKRRNQNLWIKDSSLILQILSLGSYKEKTSECRLKPSCGSFIWNNTNRERNQNM